MKIDYLTPELAEEITRMTFTVDELKNIKIAYVIRLLFYAKKEI